MTLHMQDHNDAPRSDVGFERVTHLDQLLAIIVYHRFHDQGVHFFSDPELSQQLAYMKHDTGKIIRPHVHNEVQREVRLTQEVLMIKKGKIRVDFYNQDKTYLESRILASGDVILLADGGHGFEVLEDLEMIEVKQGPYAGEKDKVLFEGVVSKDAVYSR